MLRISCILAVLLFANTALAQGPESGTELVSTSRIESAGFETTQRALARYARARSLLLAAIREFDAGYAEASPEALLDAAKWRNTLIDRAEELERVLAPQARVSRSGMKFEGDRRLLNTK